MSETLKYYTSKLKDDDSYDYIQVNESGHVLVDGLQTWLDQLQHVGGLYVVDTKTNKTYIIQRVNDQNKIE